MSVRNLTCGGAPRDADGLDGVASVAMGYGPHMDPQRTWHLARHAAVRADAPGIFVPALELPGASIGDEVIVDGPDDGGTESRRATVSSIDDRDGVTYLRLDFASPR